jgi:hypothetical protein
MSREPEDIHAALAAFADGTLPEDQRESLLARVAETPALAAELEDQRRAVMLVRSLERVEAPTLLRRSVELAAKGEAAVGDATAGEGSAAAGSLGGRASRRTRVAAAAGRNGDAGRTGDASRRRVSPRFGRRRVSPGFGRGAERASRRSSSLRLPSRLIAGVAFAAAVVVVLVLVLTTGGSTSAPTVLQASGAGLRTATGAAPAESPHNPHLLAVSAAGIYYPYWGGKLGWNAVGARTDSVGGRMVTTVLYANSRAQRIGYSIVAGPALAVPAGSTSVERRGVSFHVISHANPTIVTWREGGHTCILTARGVGAGTLMRLATWQRA